jgi:hypothetical protein
VNGDIDIVERLRGGKDFKVIHDYSDGPAIGMMTEAERRQEAADEITRLRTAIDALPDLDPFFMQPRQYARGYRDAMRQVKALLHPEAGES